MSDMSQSLEAQVRRLRRTPLFVPGDLPACNLSASDIERILPHRGPMALVQQIIGLDPESGRLEACRTLRPQDPAFDGHFPGAPVYPGAFQVELMGQAGLCLGWLCEAGLATIPDSARPSAVRLTQVRNASFISEARPGDELTILCTRHFDDGWLLGCLAQILIKDRIVSVCAFEALKGAMA